MPVVKEVNFKGEVIGDFELSDAVFGAPVHVPAMHQVVVAHLANCRVGTHNTKDRGDVRGGGKKPWRQKHTGRARKPQVARTAAETHIDFVRETLAQSLRSAARRETAERRLHTDFSPSLTS